MKLEIISPHSVVFSGEIEGASFPGLSGSFDVLPHHAPMIAALGKGVIYYEDGHTRYEQAIQSGFVEVKDDLLSVCIE